MTRDNYRGAARGWAEGAALVYAPIAAQLVGRAPDSLEGARVLDVGAGTGACEKPLRAAGVAMIVGIDLSHDMLAWNGGERPPAVVADVMHMPFPDGRFDATVASFVLNHVADPVRGLVELARVVRSGAVVLATTFANDSHSANRDTVDDIARSRGWSPPAWYDDLKTNAMPLVGAAASMRAAAIAAGLVDIQVHEDDVDVGIAEPGALVDYRFGQAPFADWLAGMSASTRCAVRTDAVDALAGVMEPYRPRVVFLIARTSA